MNRYATLGCARADPANRSGIADDRRVRIVALAAGDAQADRIEAGVSGDVDQVRRRNVGTIEPAEGEPMHRGVLTWRSRRRSRARGARRRIRCLGVMRAVGPEMPMAATTHPTLSRNGAATQRMPSANSSSSRAYPCSTMRLSEARSVSRSIGRPGGELGERARQRRLAIGQEDLPSAVQCSGESVPTGRSTRSGRSVSTLSRYSTRSSARIARCAVSCVASCSALEQRSCAVA